MEEKNENKDRILDAMWRGDLTVREESKENVEEAKDEETELTDAEKRHRQKAALEHLMSGLAFRERED